MKKSKLPSVGLTKKRIQELTKDTTVRIISGVYKKKTYTIQNLLKNGYVILKDLETLSSRKKAVKYRIHQSNLQKTTRIKV
jgi:hypothetical protein